MINLKMSLRFYIRFLSPYLIILFISICLLGQINYVKYTDILKEEINKNYAYNLQMIQSDIDAQINNLRNIVYQLSSDKEIMDYLNQYSRYDRYRIIDKLQHYKNYNSNIYELILYKRDSNNLLTSDSEYTLPEFINNYYRYSNWTEQEFTYYINNIDKSSIRYLDYITSYDSKRLKIITFGYPFSVFRKNYSSTLLILIKDSVFSEIIGNHQKIHISESNKENEVFLIIDQDMNILSSTSTYIAAEDIAVLHEKTQHTSSFTHSINNNKYLVNTTHSPINNLTFLSICPTSIYMKKINHVQFILFITLCIVMLLSIIVIILFARKNCTPIYNIYKQVSSINQSKHYLKDIKKEMGKLSTENKELSYTIENYEPIVQHYYLSKLVMGSSVNVPLSNHTNYTSLEWKHATWFVMLIRIHYTEEDSKETKQHLKLQLDNYIVEKYLARNVDILSLDHTYIFTTSQGESKCDKDGHDIIQFIHKSFNYDCTISIGNSYDSLDSIDQSFTEAQIALNYYYVYPDTPIIYYRDLPITTHKNTWNFVHEMYNLNTNLCYNNHETIDSDLDQLVYVLNTCEQPVEIVQYVCFNLINTIMRQVYDMNIYDNLFEDSLFDLFSLIEANDINTLFIKLKTICYKICNYMHQTPVNMQSISKEIIAYINANCFSCSFSIRQVAEHFNMSQSSLSQHFRHNTKKTISQYVDELRIKKSKNILKSSDQPIKSILPNIGYYDNSSFTRKFKNIVGITPGKYRTLNKK